MDNASFNKFIYRTDFIITTSIDGHIKLWKKQDLGIEFVKDYRAHLQPVVAVAASADGQLFASMSEDGSAKIFDVVNFGGTSSYFDYAAWLTSYVVDMINIIKLGFKPFTCCWVHRRNQAQGLLAMCVKFSSFVT